MSDLIDRQAAIDALDGEIEITGRTNAEAVKGYVRLVRGRLERLPSAQPEIIHCWDCIHIDPVSVRSGSLYCTKIKRYMTENDFCSLAERITDAETEV